MALTHTLSLWSHTYPHRYERGVMKRDANLDIDALAHVRYPPSGTLRKMILPSGIRMFPSVPRLFVFRPRLFLALAFVAAAIYSFQGGDFGFLTKLLH
jgi:hypothetical protein